MTFVSTDVVGSTALRQDHPREMAPASARHDDIVRSVRAGLHTGETEERDGDCLGPVLNQAARIMAVAGGAGP